MLKDTFLSAETFDIRGKDFGNLKRVSTFRG